MPNDIILLPVVLIVAICLGTGFWLFAHTVRDLRESTQRQLEAHTQGMHILVTATQNALAQSQQEAIALRRALTRTQGQGQWGEMQLERIVDLAGIRPYCSEFQSQFTSPAGKLQKPDLQVTLPNGRKIIIDAKAPVDAYIQAHEALDEGTRITRLRHYAQRVRENMLGLAKKEYWKLVAPSPVWVVLFIPNEGMFHAALEYDDTLLDTAIKQNVLLASPITLLALLKAMDYGWKQEKRTENAQQIIEYSQALHTELSTFVTQWKELRKDLAEMTTAFNKCIATYESTVFPAIQHICELDGTSNTDHYSLSGIPKLRGPKRVVDLRGEEEAFQKEKSHKGSGTNKNDAEAKLSPKPESLDESEPVQESHAQEEAIPISLESGDMLCPYCHTPYRESAKFCKRCGQSLAETEALPQIDSATEAGRDDGSISLAELRQMKKTEATIERFRRGVEAIMAYNATVDQPERWYINVTSVRQLVGGRAPNIQEYLDSRRAEIEAHHHRHRLSPSHNRGKTISITECVTSQNPETNKAINP